MSVTLLTPVSPPVGTLDSYSVLLSWDGGEWDASVPFGDGTVSVSPPLPPSTFDLLVLGWVDGGVAWRGLSRGLSTNAQPTVLFTKVNAFSRFAQLTNQIPDLAGSAASPLGLGQVLLTGGISPTLGTTALAVIYDQGSASFLQVQPLVQPMSHHLALPLMLVDPAQGPEWLLAGGDNPLDGGASAQAEIYSTNYDGEPQPDMPEGQVAPSGSWFDSSGSSAVVGCGLTASGVARAFVFKPGSGFEPLLPGNCIGGQVAWVPNAGVVVMGLADGGVVLLLDGGVMPLASIGVTSGFGSAVYQGSLTVLGGVGPSGVAQDVQRVFPALDIGLLDAGRANFGSVLLDGGQLLLVGGNDSSGKALATAELFSLQNLASIESFATNVARIHPAVSDIPGYGAALIISGETETGQPAGGFEVFTYQ